MLKLKNCLILPKIVKIWPLPKMAKLITIRGAKWKKLKKILPYTLLSASPAKWLSRGTNQLSQNDMLGSLRIEKNVLMQRAVCK